MPRILDLFRVLLIAVAGWVNQRHRQRIEYLREENRVLREPLGGRRVRFHDDQRRWAAQVKGLRRKLLTSGTFLAWHRKLTAQKYDGSG